MLSDERIDSDALPTQTALASGEIENQKETLAAISEVKNRLIEQLGSSAVEPITPAGFTVRMGGHVVSVRGSTSGNLRINIPKVVAQRFVKDGSAAEPTVVLKICDQVHVKLHNPSNEANMYGIWNPRLKGGDGKQKYTIKHLFLIFDALFAADE
jgi:hypothetical protein